MTNWYRLWQDIKAKYKFHLLGKDVIRIKSIITTVIVIIFLLLVCFLTNGAANDFAVMLQGERITLSAEKTPLRAILGKLTEQGVSVKLDPQINPLITADYSNSPIEQVFSSIINSASYSLLWESKKESEGTFKISLTEIQIFRSGEKDLMEPLLLPEKNVIAELREGSYYVKNQILLQLEANIDISELTSYLKKHNATVTPSKIPSVWKIVFHKDVNIEKIIEEIKSIFGIDFIELNYAYPIQKPITYPPSFLAAKDGLKYYAPTSNSPPIAILDSGLSDSAADFGELIISSFDVNNPDVMITDTLGHGTQMALIATGIVEPYGSEDVRGEFYNPIIAIKAFDDDGFITNFNIIESINFALENNAKVMSLSWGTETNNAFMEKAFEYASAKGLIIVAAAGNEPTGKPVYPAAYPTVIGVGALGPHGTEKWDNSNYGSFVTFYAPGFANLPIGYKGEPGIYAGTSISTAYVAYSISRFLSQNPLATEKEILEFFKNNNQ